MSTNPANIVPSWPSLYNPGLEILNIQGNDPIQPGAHYLYRATDVFRFTFYWTLLFYTPLFVFCGLYAFWNYAFPVGPSSIMNARPLGEYPMTSISSHSLDVVAPPLHPAKPKMNERRSRMAFALIVLLTFVIFSLAGAVVGSAILGFVVFGLYKAASFNMSTWIPFLLSILQVVTGLLSIWPSIIEII